MQIERISQAFSLKKKLIYSLNKDKMKIKKQYLFAGFIAVAITFASCKKKDSDTKQPELSVSSSEELFTSGGGTSEVAVTSNGNWSIQNSTTWCTTNASTTSGNGKITFTVQPNPVTSERSVIFSVTSGTIFRDIKIREL